MTIAEETVRYVYQGPFAVGETVPIPFTYAENNHVKLARNEDPLRYAIDYIVAGQNVTLKTAIAGADKLVVYRETPLNNESDFPQEALFDSAKIEDALDKLTMQQQEQDDLIARAVLFPIDAPEGLSISLPLPEANKGLKWNEDGTDLINTKLDPDEAASAAEDAQHSAEEAQHSAEEALKSAEEAAQSAQEALVSANNAAMSAARAEEATHKITAELPLQTISTTAGNVRGYVLADGKVLSASSDETWVGRVWGENYIHIPHAQTSDGKAITSCNNLIVTSLEENNLYIYPKMQNENVTIMAGTLDAQGNFVPKLFFVPGTKCIPVLMKNSQSIISVQFSPTTNQPTFSFTHYTHTGNVIQMQGNILRVIYSGYLGYAYSLSDEEKASITHLAFAGVGGCNLSDIGVYPTSTSLVGGYVPDIMEASTNTFSFTGETSLETLTLRIDNSTLKVNSQGRLYMDTSVLPDGNTLKLNSQGKLYMDTSVLPTPVSAGMPNYAVSSAYAQNTTYTCQSNGYLAWQNNETTDDGGTSTQITYNGVTRSFWTQSTSEDTDNTYFAMILPLPKGAQFKVHATDRGRTIDTTIWFFPAL